jgi:hypothetical protein
MLMRTPAPKPLLGWPSDRSTPTEEQWAEAERRYLTTCEAESESDWNMGLRYVMATYDRLLWLGFFFPEEEAQFRFQYESGQRYVEKRPFTADDLIAFEKEVAAEFEAGKIAAPVHFAGGNEQPLIDIFASVAPDDWVLASWRAHYHCLLKGVPPDELRAAIQRGRSIGLCFPQHRILCSAIVGGICPIAVGIALGIKSRGGRERVHCFVGDMAAQSGIYHESVKYAVGRGLPIRWIVEDNGMSVRTETAQAWGLPSPGPLQETWSDGSYVRYRYTLSWPHVGIGKWVSF